MSSVTAIVITKNEEKNIGECIDSLIPFCERILVVDSFSEDKTCEIAEKAGCEVYRHPFETHAAQRNWAIDNIDITSKWILRIDADERLTPELINEFNTLMDKHSDDDVNGVTAEAWLYFLGRKIKHGCPNKRKLILFKTGKGRIEERRMDEHTVLLSGTSVEAKNRFIHYDFKNISDWIKKLEWYSSLETEDYFEYLNSLEENTSDKKADMSDKVIGKTRQKKFGFYYRLPMFARTWFLFIFNYIIRLGFLDGREGYIYNYMYHRWYRSLVDTKIFERKISEKRKNK